MSYNMLLVADTQQQEAASRRVLRAGQRPLKRVLVERATIPGRVIDGGDVIVLQARGKKETLPATASTTTTTMPS